MTTAAQVADDLAGAIFDGTTLTWDEASQAAHVAVEYLMDTGRMIRFDA